MTVVAMLENIKNMPFIKSMFFWVAVRNPNGLTAMLTFWCVHPVVFLIRIFIFNENVNIPLMTEYLFFSGIGLFFAVPLLERLCGSRDGSSRGPNIPLPIALITIVGFIILLGIIGITGA